jgi:hypothetical protein
MCTVWPNKAVSMFPWHPVTNPNKAGIVNFGSSDRMANTAESGPNGPNRASPVRATVSFVNLKLEHPASCSSHLPQEKPPHLTVTAVWAYFVAALI